MVSTYAHKSQFLNKWIPVLRKIVKASLEPLDRQKVIQAMLNQADLSESGPCGNFSEMYQCMCNLMGLPVREEVGWVRIDLYQEFSWCSLCFYVWCLKLILLCWSEGKGHKIIVDFRTWIRYTCLRIARSSIWKILIYRTSSKFILSCFFMSLSWNLLRSLGD